MSKDDVLVFFRKRQEHWNARDVAALSDGHTPTCVCISPIFGVLKGRDDIRTAYRQVFEIFPDWQLAGEDPIVDGNRVSQFFTVKATHVGEFLGYTGSNKRFEIQGVQLYRMEAGLIGHERRVYDFTGLLVQVGVLRARPAK